MIVLRPSVLILCAVGRCVFWPLDCQRSTDEAGSDIRTCWVGSTYPQCGGYTDLSRCWYSEWNSPSLRTLDSRTLTADHDTSQVDISLLIFKICTANIIHWTPLCQVFWEKFFQLFYKMLSIIDLLRLFFWDFDSRGWRRWRNPILSSSSSLLDLGSI